jgi:hypothetical protein
MKLKISELPKHLLITLLLMVSGCYFIDDGSSTSLQEPISLQDKFIGTWRITGLGTYNDSGQLYYLVRYPLTLSSDYGTMDFNVYLKVEQDQYTFYDEFFNATGELAGTGQEGVFYCSHDRIEYSIEGSRIFVSEEQSGDITIDNNILRILWEGDESYFYEGERAADAVLNDAVEKCSVNININWDK